MYVSHIDYRALVAEYGKRCPVCKRKLRASAFADAKNRHDGKSAYCKECMQKKYGATKRAYCRKRTRWQRLERYRQEERARMMKEGITDEELLQHAALELASERDAAERRSRR